jgi:DNA-binding NtrC family response regulator
MTANPAASAQSAAAPRILVVDDDALIRASLAGTLRGEGCLVEAAADAPAARAAAARAAAPFAVIISDFQMPHQDGLSLLAEMRERQPLATRILITGVLTLDAVADALGRGEIFRFLVKPWIREELLATVRNAIERHRLLVERDAAGARESDLRTALARCERELAETRRQAAVLQRQLREAVQRHKKSLPEAPEAAPARGIYRPDGTILLKDGTA